MHSPAELKNDPIAFVGKNLMTSVLSLFHFKNNLFMIDKPRLVVIVILILVSIVLKNGKIYKVLM